MNKIIKYWIIGTLGIVALFLLMQPPTNWTLYLDYLLNTPISYSIQQGAFLFIGGAVFGSALMIIQEMFS